MDLSTLIGSYRIEKQKLDNRIKTIAQKELRLFEILSEIKKKSEPYQPNYNDIHKYQKGDEILFRFLHPHCDVVLTPNLLSVYISDLASPLKEFRGTKVRSCYNHWNKYLLQKQQEDLENLPF